MKYYFGWFGRVVGPTCIDRLLVRVAAFLGERWSQGSLWGASLVQNIDAQISVNINAPKRENHIFSDV